MEKILIGSTAIKKHFSDFPRNPKDVDYAVKSTKYKNQKGLEHLLNPILFGYHCSDSELPSKDVLYTLKLSHMFWDINWKKHLYDIMWLKEKECNIILPLFYELYEYWNNYHSKNKRSDLKMTSDSFFSNVVKCDYDHDWLHTLIQNPPTFTKVLIGEVEVSEDKFNALSFKEKCNLVQEEI